MTTILDKSSRSLAAAAAAASTVNEERRRGKKMERGHKSDAVLYWFLTTELTGPKLFGRFLRVTHPFATLLLFSFEDMVSFTFRGETLAWETNLNGSSLFSSTCQGPLSGKGRSANERTSCCSGKLERKWASSF
jgi:hypothetical protein